jgi:3-oxoacyl-[acyl-carrier protein] reductase
LPRPEDIATTVAYLVGPDGARINGQTHQADGGMI